MIISTYRDCLAIRNYQPSSLRKNVQLASKFLAWAGDVHAINSTIVENYLINLLKMGRTIKTVKNHQSAIKAFCDFLASRGYITDNPVLTMKSLKLPEEIPVCLTDDEVLKTYKIAKREKMFCEVTLALNTGLRMEEMRQLKWADIGSAT